MKTELLKFSNRIQELSSITEEEILQNQDFFKIQTLKKGDHFLREGKICTNIAFINQGTFRIYRLKNGEELNTCFCMKCDVMSSFESFVNQTPSQDNIQALEDAEFITLSHSNFIKLVASNPSWNSLRITLTDHECVRLANRANTLSSETALEKYQNLLVNEPEIIQRISNYHIASYLGITRETLSRIRGQIK
mgnify:CR=1 FL=1